jgi:hypothetical protein
MKKAEFFVCTLTCLDKYLNDLTTIMNGGGPGLGIVLPHIAASDSTDQRTTADDTANIWLILTL